MIQPTGEPREQHLGSTQNVRATQNFIKNKKTRKVVILWRIFGEIEKKFEMKSQERTNIVFGLFIWKGSKNYFFGSCNFNFNFFAVFSKIRRSITNLPVFLSFIKNFVAQTYRTCFFFKWLKNISAIYKSIILYFSVNLPVIFIYKFCNKENLI